jgi:hypothetical protein
VQRRNNLRCRDQVLTNSAVTAFEYRSHDNHNVVSCHISHYPLRAEVATGREGGKICIYKTLRICFLEGLSPYFEREALKT